MLKVIAETGKDALSQPPLPFTTHPQQIQTHIVDWLQHWKAGSSADFKCSPDKLESCQKL